MTDCGGLLVLLTAVHLHFNTLMQLTAQLCCHLMPPAAQESSRKSSTFIFVIAIKYYIFMNHFSTIKKHWSVVVQRLSLSLCKVSNSAVWFHQWFRGDFTKRSCERSRSKCWSGNIPQARRARPEERGRCASGNSSRVCSIFLIFVIW